MGIKKELTEIMSDIDFKSLTKEMSGSKKSKSTSSSITFIGDNTDCSYSIWSAVTELDNVVRGSGKTFQRSKISLYNHQKPVFKKRYFNEGDFVKKGNVLFDISPIDAKTQLDQAQSDFASLESGN